MYFSDQYGFFIARCDDFGSSWIVTDSFDSSDDPFEKLRHVWGVRIKRGDSEETNSRVLYLWNWEGLHLVMEIPLYTGHGVHDVFRATPIPHPIPQTERATQYHMSRTHLLTSPDKTNFAEVTEQEHSTPCWDSHRPRFCKQPFSTIKSQQMTCLTGLSFNLPATVLKLCAQQVVALHQHPLALYLLDSMYLLTSAKGDFIMQILTEQGELRSPGCESCPVKPSCKGR